MTDGELLGRFVRAKSEKAFRTLVERYSDAVFSACLRRLGSRDLAEDAAQAVFIVLTQNAHKIRRGKSVASFLFKTAKYVCSHAVRAEARRRRREKEVAEMRHKENLQTEESWEEIRPHIDAALERLPQKQREAVIMYYFCGKKQREIAQELRCPQSTVQMRIDAGLKKLRVGLAKFGVAASTGVLATLLGARALEAAPVGFAASAGSAALAGTAGGTASGPGFLLAKGAMKMMIWAKIKLVAACVTASVTVAGVGASIAVKAIAQNKPEERQIIAQAPADVKTNAKPVIILDTASFWRVHYTMKPPVVKKGEAVEEVKFPTAPWLMHHTTLPPAGWEKADFDDSGWARFPGTLSLKGQLQHNIVKVKDPKPPFLALECMRGKFEVTDPSKVKGLALSASYRGGIVVYLNGKEIARGHLPKNGKGGLEQLAEIGTDDRNLTDVRIPDGILQKGVNILAVEAHRSTYGEKDVYTTSKKRSKNVYIDKGNCGILSIRLTAPSSKGIVPNIARPKGFQIWNSSPVMLDCDMDYGDPSETLKPVKIVGTQNGAFSGKAVVGCERADKGTEGRDERFEI